MDPILLIVLQDLTEKLLIAVRSGNESMWLRILDRLKYVDSRPQRICSDDSNEINQINYFSQLLRLPKTQNAVGFYNKLKMLISKSHQIVCMIINR